MTLLDTIQKLADVVRDDKYPALHEWAWWLDPPESTIQFGPHQRWTKPLSWTLGPAFEGAVWGSLQFALETELNRLSRLSDVTNPEVRWATDAWLNLLSLHQYGMNRNTGDVVKLLKATAKAVKKGTYLDGAEARRSP